MWVQSLDWEDALEKEMATQSSILAWKIPWTEEPGGLQSMGLQRVRHNWYLFICVDLFFQVVVQKVCHVLSYTWKSRIFLVLPSEEHGNPVQYSCLENSMVRGAWWAIVQGTKSQTELSD